MLAFQSSEFIDSIAASIEKFTPMSIATRRELVDDLAQIRKNGFAINRGERMAGVCGVAAPVVNSAGAANAAIGISGPAERLTYRVLRSYGPLVRDIAKRLSHDLGGTPVPIVEASTTAQRAASG